MNSDAYLSVGYCTSNEDKLREATIEYRQTFWRWITFRPALKEVWVGGSIWYGKTNGQRASNDKCLEIDCLVDQLNKMSKELDRK